MNRPTWLQDRRMQKCRDTAADGRRFLRRRSGCWRDPWLNAAEYIALLWRTTISPVAAFHIRATPSARDRQGNCDSA
jgi:hypothetical protein